MIERERHTCSRHDRGPACYNQIDHPAGVLHRPLSHLRLLPPSHQQPNDTYEAALVTKDTRVLAGLSNGYAVGMRGKVLA